MSIRHIILLLLFVSSTGTGCAQNRPKDTVFLTNLIAIVQENHIAPKPLDDVLSREIFYSFLHKIDPDKKLFLSEEVIGLKLSEGRLDDELKNGTIYFLGKVYELLRKSEIRAEKYANDCFEEGINIFKDDYFERDIEKNDFASGEYLRKKWALTIKKRFIEELYIAEIVESNIPFEEVKHKALAKTKVFFQNYFNNIKGVSESELLEMFINAYVSANDYQSGFFSPKSKSAWDNNFSRNFVGIGISIEATFDYPIVSEVVFNGPAWKTHKINTGDILLKISDEDNQLIDVAGMPIEKVLELLRGTQGSKVLLRVKKTKNNIEDIEVERNLFSLPKTMSFILEDSKDHSKVGYIYLPRFYSGAENCSIHVLEALKKLEQLQTKGIILDLRDNQGGSASEARKIIGYFLKGGAVMQIVYADKNHRIFEDDDSTSIYSGKLVVLVNEGSSSASELLSGTLQDYHRAIVVGSQTYGKGTVQRFFEVINKVDSTKVGEVKLSIAKFYTGNGRSIQYIGVTPHIVFPSANMYIKTGERAEHNSLRFESLNPMTTTKSEDFERIIQSLTQLSQARKLKNKYFKIIKNQAILKKFNEERSLINLNYAVYKKEKINEPSLNKSSVMIKVLPTSNSELDLEKANYWGVQLNNDEYLLESMMILKDYLQMNK